MSLDNTPQRVTPALLARIERARLIVARVVAIDPAGLPIFERLDAEYSAAQAEVAARRIDDPIAKARALAQARKAS